MKRNPRWFFGMLAWLVYLICSASAPCLAETKIDPAQYPEFAKKLEAIFHTSPVEVSLVDPLDSKLQIFKSYQLLTIVADGKPKDPKSPFLADWVLPSGGSVGTFASHGKELIYLSQQKETLGKILVEEKTLEDPKLNLESFAKVLAIALLDARNVDYHLISSKQDILDFEKDKGVGGGGYEVDRKSLKAVESLIAAPKWEEKNGGKKLTFFCLSGWMHEIHLVDQITVSFSQGGAQIEIQDKVLNKDIFKKVPMIEY